MKKKSCLLILGCLMCIFLFSGCVRYNTIVEVKPNGKADVSIIMAVSESLSQMDDSNNEDDPMDTETIKKTVEKEGWEFETYSEEGYKGYLITKKDVDLENIQEELKSGDTDGGITTEGIDVKKDGSKYTITCKVNQEQAGSEENIDQYASYLNSSGGYAKFTLKLPNKAIENNATEVSEDGKTLTWDLLNMQKDPTIKATFQLTKPLPVALISIIAIAIILIIFAIVIIILLKSKKKQTEDTSDEEINTNEIQ